MKELRNRIKNMLPSPLIEAIRSIKSSLQPGISTSPSITEYNVSWNNSRPRNLSYLEELNDQFPVQFYLDYDDAELVRRSEERMDSLISKLGNIKNKKILEIGAGLGENIFVLARHASMAVGTDVLHFARASEGLKGVDNKELRRPWFINTGAETLPFRNNSFDVVFSYNAFEHFYDPRAAFNECLRTLKPYGLFYTRFGPLFRSAWGAHIYNRIYIPWVQLLFPEQVIVAFYDKHGWDSDKVLEDRTMYHWLNQYSLEQFRQIFFSPEASVVSYKEIQDKSQTDWLAKIAGSLREFSSTDLLVSTIEIMVQKIPFPEKSQDILSGT